MSLSRGRQVAAAAAVLPDTGEPRRALAEAPGGLWSEVEVALPQAGREAGMVLEVASQSAVLKDGFRIAARHLGS